MSGFSTAFTDVAVAAEDGRGAEGADAWSLYYCHLPLPLLFLREQVLLRRPVALRVARERHLRSGYVHRPSVPDSSERDHGGDQTVTINCTYYWGEGGGATCC